LCGCKLVEVIKVGVVAHYRKVNSGKVVKVLKVGVVAHCRKKGNPGKLALKIINKKLLTGEQEATIGHELALIRRLRHSNLLQLIDELNTPTEWYFVVELFPVSIADPFLHFS
jgi:hypothetical protein